MWIVLLIAAALSYSCTFSLPDGSKYDLSVFTREVPDYEADAMDYIYRLNICSDTIKLCNGEPAIATQWYYNGGCTAVLARQGPIAPVLTKTVDGIMLTYTNGDMCTSGPRKVVYNFHCSKGETRVGLAEETQMCLYAFDIYSKDACFGAKAKSRGYGWMAYGGIALVLVYFVGGWAYNKYQDKDLGVIEAIPHSGSVIECMGGAWEKLRRPSN